MQNISLGKRSHNLSKSTNFQIMRDLVDFDNNKIPKKVVVAQLCSPNFHIFQKVVAPRFGDLLKDQKPLSMV